MDKKKIIFVIGAGRSGTHLLADTLTKNVEASYYNEINDFWKKPFVFLKTDYIPENYSETNVLYCTRLI